MGLYPLETGFQERLTGKNTSHIFQFEVSITGMIQPRTCYEHD